jgi:hypothetical protein
LPSQSLRDSWQLALTHEKLSPFPQVSAHGREQAKNDGEILGLNHFHILLRI